MKKVTVLNLATGKETTVEAPSEMYAVQAAYVEATGDSWGDAYENTRHGLYTVSCGDFAAVVKD